MKKLIFAVAVFTLSACTSQELYHYVQHNKVQDCRKMVDPLYEECMEQYGKSWEDYERERQELLAEEKTAATERDGQ